MLGAPDIGDEITFSFDLQTSVYLASSLVTEMPRSSWNKVQSLLQGSGLSKCRTFQSLGLGFREPQSLQV